MKRILGLLIVSLLATGCIQTGGSATASGFFRTSDGGKTWEAKNQISEKQSIAATDILSLAVGNQEDGLVYLGTREAGIFKTTSGGESWERLEFPPAKVYGLVLNPQNNSILYTTGLYNDSGKIYKSVDGGGEWKEIYTEPSGETVLISLAINRANPEVLYAGNSSGIVVKTTDGGNTWSNVLEIGSPVIALAVERAGSATYALINNKSLMKTADGGSNWETLKVELSQGEQLNPRNISEISALELDPSAGGTLYIGTNEGMLASFDGGTTWREVSILSDSQIPITAIAVNPGNSSEMFYASAQAIYKSTDGGARWTTRQVTTSKTIRTLEYNPLNTGQLFVGFDKGTGKGLIPLPN